MESCVLAKPPSKRRRSKHVILRDLRDEDAEVFEHKFKQIGWDKPAQLFHRYAEVRLDDDLTLRMIKKLRPAMRSS